MTDYEKVLIGIEPDISFYVCVDSEDETIDREVPLPWQIIEKYLDANKQWMYVQDMLYTAYKLAGEGKTAEQIEQRLVGIKPLQTKNIEEAKSKKQSQIERYRLLLKKMEKEHDAGKVPEDIYQKLKSEYELKLR